MLTELQVWGERYERRGQRRLTRNVRYSPEEWNRVEDLAAKAGWPPAKYLRLATLYVSSILQQKDEEIEQLSDLLFQVLDLVLLNPSPPGHAASAGASTDSHWDRLQELRDRLEHLQAAFCFHRRDRGHSASSAIWQSVEPMPTGEPHIRSHDALTRTETRTVRFRHDEWQRVLIRARRAGLKPTSYVRAASLGAPAADHGAQRVLSQLQALAARTLDLLEHAPGLTAHLPGTEDMMKGLRRLIA